ncbi:hypothetical protein BD413DRAFT_522721 [Trametes elegans]|nr:hypothetical protein BD413DRAFT_522721 [Trametes elegans]
MSESRLSAPSPGTMDVSLAFQALVKNQVDQVLKETHRRQWADWVHEDLRQSPAVARKERKRRLLEDIPGLLSGYVAVTLADNAWAPACVLSTTIPRSELVDTTYSSDLRICNVVWDHRRSGIISVSLFTITSMRGRPLNTSSPRVPRPLGTLRGP